MGFGLKPAILLVACNGSTHYTKKDAQEKSQYWRNPSSVFIQGVNPGSRSSIATKFDSRVTERIPRDNDSIPA